jgi:hypothetical protein
MMEMTQEEKNSGRENKHCYLEAYISGTNKKYWDSGCKIFFTLTRCEQTFHKCWQDNKLTGIPTNINLRNEHTVACSGNYWISA